MNNYYMQFSNCIAIKGYSRTAIYDLQRTRYILVDNHFAGLLSKYENKIPINKIKGKWKHYIDKLIEDEWGFLTTKSLTNLFPPLSLEWKHYAEITNAQIDLCNNDEDINRFFSSLLPQLEALSCKTFQINFLNHIHYEHLFSFLERFSDTQVHLLVIFLPYNLIISNEANNLYKMQPRLNYLCFYSCPPNLDGTIKNGKSFYSDMDINVRNNNIISMKYFTANITFFSESQHFNTYYNRKLCISADGEIKNTPEQLCVYGNIRNTLLSEVLKNKEFKSLWTIHKEMIDVCKECEYRHMCVDACNLIKRKDNTWYRSKECNYNPYICKWSHEEGYKTLSECGVKVNEHEFQIENAKLNEICKELWDE